MFRRFFLAALLIGSISIETEVWSQSLPTLINYQGQLVDASGTPLATGNRKLEVSIFDAATGGTVVYGPQVFAQTPVVNGYYNILLGPVDTTNRSIENSFAGGERYLEVKVDDKVMSPRQRILSVPFAFNAKNATMAAGVAAGGVASSMIAPNAVGAAQIAANAVGATQIADNAITAAKVADGAVGSSEIVDNSIQTVDIKDGSITTSKFNSAAVVPKAESVNRVAAYKSVNTTAFTVPGNPPAAVPYPGATISQFKLRASSGAVVTFYANWYRGPTGGGAIIADLNGSLIVSGILEQAFGDSRYYPASGGANVTGTIYVEVYVPPTASERFLDISVKLASANTTADVKNGRISVTEVLSEQIQN